MKNLKDYILENFKINESVRSRDIEKAIKLISQLLVKKKIYPYDFILPLEKNGKNKFGVLAWTEKGEGVCFCWDRGDSSQIESILFTSKFDELVVSWSSDNQESFKWDVAVECKGASLVKICELTIGVLSGKIEMSTVAINKNLANFQLFESNDEFINEAIDDPIIKRLEKEKFNIYQRLKYNEKKGKDVTELQAQYDELKKKLHDAKLAVRSTVITTLLHDVDTETIEDSFEEEIKVTPEERFEDMTSYIYNVISGIRPLAVICGAPGVGKTFRIMQAIKQTKSKIDTGNVMTHGVDYGIIKGKSTPAHLYTMMHDFKNEGQLLVLDDADEIVKDPTAINLIKACCDSSDDRWVSYGTSRPPEMPEEQAYKCDDAEGPDNKGRYFYPKEFETHGGMIIITNMNAGQIDTAIKNRALMCDLNFTTDEVLDIVRKLSPKIKPDVLSKESKEKALAYLQELADKKVPMEISIRSFTLVAGLYSSGAPEAAIQRRIREQMKLQFARGGKKY